MMSNRKSRKTKIASSLIALVVATAVFVGWWSGQRRRQHIIEGSLSPVPSLDTVSPELRSRVLAAVEEARSGRDRLSSLVELSRLYHANGYFTEASKCYEGLLQLDPQNPKWADLQASILGGFGRLEEAVSLLRLVDTRAPDQIASRIRLGDALVKLNQLDRAAEVYRSVLVRDPKNVYGLLGLARCDEAAQRWQQAEDNLQKALQFEPDFGIAWARLATVAERLGHRDLERLALTHSEKNSRFHEIPDPWLDELREECYDLYQLRVASAVEHAARHEEAAIHLLERALRLAPDDASTHREFGRLLLYQRDFVGSRSHLEKAAALAPDDSENWISLGLLADAASDTAAATRVTLAGLSHNPASPGLRLQRGRQLMALGQPAAALAEFSEAQRLRPNEAEALVEIALVHLRTGNPDEAVKQLVTALLVEPDHPMALIALARIEIEKGDQKTARDLIASAGRQSRVPARDWGDLVSAFKQKFNTEP